MSEDLRLRVQRPRPGEMLLSELARLYVGEVGVTASAAYASQTRTHFDTLLSRLRDIPVSDLSEPLIHAYRAKRREEGVSKTTVNHETGVLTRALRLVKAQGRIESNQLAELRPLPVKQKDRRKRRRALSDEQRQAILEVAEADDARCLKAGWRVFPQAPLYAAMLDSGARRGELLGSLWQDWRFHVVREGVATGLAMVTLWDTKNQADRTMFVLPDAATAVEGLREVHNELLGRPARGSDPVFLTPAGKPWGPANARNCLRTFDKLLAQAGIPKVDAHGRSLDTYACRTSFNVEMDRSEVPSDDRAPQLGHSREVNNRWYIPKPADRALTTARKVLERRLRLQGLDPADFAEDIEGALAALLLGSGTPTASPQEVAGPGGGKPLSQFEGVLVDQVADGNYRGDVGEVANPFKIRPARRGRGQVVNKPPDALEGDHLTENQGVTGSSPVPPTSPSGGQVDALTLETEALPVGVVLHVVLVGKGRSCSRPENTEDCDASSEEPRGPEAPDLD